MTYKMLIEFEIRVWITNYLIYSNIIVIKLMFICKQIIYNIIAI